MTKIVRYNGNLAAFASTATGTERTVFGSITQSDTLDDNINADFLTGWEIVGVNDAPSKQDFNGLAYTMSQVLAYLHQMGVAEWNTAQEYHIGSVTTTGSVVYMSLTNTNTGNIPSTSHTNWRPISEVRTIATTTDATVTAIATIPVPLNSMINIQARISGKKSDGSEVIVGYVKYAARRVAGGAIEVGAPITDIIDDSVASPVVDADVSGNNVRILVTGIVAVTYSWICSYKYDVIV